MEAVVKKSPCKVVKYERKNVILNTDLKCPHSTKSVYVSDLVALNSAETFFVRLLSVLLLRWKRLSVKLRPLTGPLSVTQMITRGNRA